MTTKPSKTAAKTKPAPKGGGEMEATFPEAPEPEKAAAVAKMLLKPSVNAAVVTESYSKSFGEVDLGALMRELSQGMEGVWAGDMKRAEAMLYGQAHALQSIFGSLARRATGQQYLKQWDADLRMALKAQNQCRMTLETLATIKNPPVVIARQANINNGGQQQVNNGPAEVSGAIRAGARAGAHAGESKTNRSELLEVSDGERLDTRTQSTAGGADPILAPVGTIDRAAQV